MVCAGIEVARSLKERFRMARENDTQQEDRTPKEPLIAKVDKTLDKVGDAVAQFWNDLRIGDGHMAGMGRKGGVEFGQYLPAFNNAGMGTVEDHGVFPNRTQGEIATTRNETGLDANEEQKVAQAAEALK